MENEKPKIGDVLIAKDDSHMVRTHEQTLTKGKEYPVKKISERGVHVTDDEGEDHLCTDWQALFTLKEPTEKRYRLKPEFAKDYESYEPGVPYSEYYKGNLDVTVGECAAIWPEDWELVADDEQPAEKQRHTPEPWLMHKHKSAMMMFARIQVEKSCQPIAEIYSTQTSINDNEEAEANAARIVACVNTCAGIEDPAAHMLGLVERGYALKQENEKLRTALAGLLPESVDNRTPAYRHAKELLKGGPQC